MKRPMALMAMILLLSMALGIISGPMGSLSPILAKAATKAPQIDSSIPIDSIIKIPVIPIEPTDPPIFKIPDLELMTRRPLVPLVTPTPSEEKANDPTPKPQTGGGKYLTSEGPLFLSFRSDLSEQFYMFTPMDLSLDGEYHFPLVGSTRQTAGEAKVVVKSGMAIVTYLLVKGVDVDDKDEFYTFFPDISSVETLRPSKLQKVKLKFGVPYSVANWLGSDPKVLLYINLPASYKTGLKGLTSFSFEDADYLRKVVELVQLMD